ncbi:MAG: acyl-CoA dehydrogenase family protein [Xanthobacteraceae bacterium]|nr:acyl-CoA dehydrogenase family protein [Xanthobacteraceae bacterium]
MPELNALFDQIAVGAADREQERTLPFEAIDLIKQARIGALRIPGENGTGISIRDLFDIAIRLAAADANVAHILRNHFTVVEQLVRHPVNGRARDWQQAVLNGALIGLATTELASPKVGNVAPDTTLTPDGEGYRLNGTKYYSTGTLYADYVLVRFSDPHGTTGAAVIPVDRAGIEIVDDWDGMGQRLTASGTTHFRNVWVERDEAFPDSTEFGYGVPYSNTFAQLFLTSVNAGILSAIHRDAVALVRSRHRTFYYAPTERAVDDPILQQTVGEISAAAFAAEAVVLAAASALDVATALAEARDSKAGDAAHRAALLAAKAKITVDELVLRAGSRIFDVGGASATRRGNNLDRHWRNARTLSSHNPVTLKARAIGDHDVNGTPLPAKGFF